ncbi:hypothetical protein AYO20_05010 [Fonsecaea nubica]|uniref:Uncharacterized protein n=1 Tax=Fonsecaea nubica TaxID=856822 RepID=A0A178D0M7_9EURO|nr:hypothetical protein AYO20_05010 [Fonsecaea nubica]OAL35629.1 hypothetical protein AYO20_05010 [Fonsecaea nubica]
MSADLYAAFLVEETTSKPEQTNDKRANVTNNPSPPRITESVHGIQRQNVSSPLWQRDTGGSDILFDAEQPDVGDEFGDFETAGDSTTDLNKTGQADSLRHEGVMSTKAIGPEPLILDLPDTIGLLDNPSHPETKVSQTLGAQRTLSGTEPTEIGKQPSWDDDWGDFEETESQPLPPLTTEVKAQPSDDDWEPIEDNVPHSMQQTIYPQPPTSRKDNACETETQSRDQTLTYERPSNVPPPSSLLQLLSSVFGSIHESNADSVLSKSELASKVLLIFRVSSRIVAGRTLRWKRDTVLAQSVRIGQSGKSGGMKLAAVNKSETTKEERETEEMIRDWSSYLHEFNSILAQAEVPPCRMRLSSTPPIKRLGTTHLPDMSKPCALCALKRTERLKDVDADVDDLFGEFWVEHWGHKDCFDFWYSYKDMLKHR